MIFTLDVGSGTQDFLLFTNENIRNCPKAVLPSQTSIIAKKIVNCNTDVYLYGYTMGGGPIKKAVVEHISKGFKVYSDRRAALTFADNLKKVEKIGIKISQPKDDVLKIKTKDVDIEFFRSFLGSIGYELPDTFAIAVQDHGYSPNESNRIFRFKLFRRMISRNAHISSFLFHHKKIPKEYNRMIDAANSILDFVDGEVYVIDTVFAAVAGCAEDAKLPALLISFGNSHTTAVVLNKDMEIVAILEHHTRILRERGRKYVAELFKRFLDGKIDNEYILNDGGHGCFIRELVETRDTVCTGPNTWLSNYREVRGDPMVVGNIGMLRLLHEIGVVNYRKLKLGALWR